ncbi:hypothetical protein, partial [Streptomyces sp. URMC 123]|uniref:hypothetical protein n=1 Tax=Streptomyces sp. URMC 123 TaxID=3423403 RepID=UPI003F1AC0D6
PGHRAVPAEDAAPGGPPGRPLGTGAGAPWSTSTGLTGLGLPWGAEADPAADARATADGSDGLDGAVPADGRNSLYRFGLSGAVAECGPELSSPEGVEAQTCVMTEGRDTWARTYYRNATGEPLVAALTLMRPDGRTVQVHCPMAAKDDPGACETPRAPRAPRAPGGTAAHHPPYGPRGTAPTAVAEIASADWERLLLRSGSYADRP